jgi:Mor family transcriptional regulator
MAGGRQSDFVSDTKMAEQQAEKIYLLRAGGMTMTALAERYHISAVTISRILRQERERREETPAEDSAA